MRKYTILATLLVVSSLVGCYPSERLDAETEEPTTEITTEETTQTQVQSNVPEDFSNIGEMLKILDTDDADTKEDKQNTISIAQECVKEICNVESTNENVHKYFNDLEPDIKAVLGIGQTLYKEDEFQVDAFGSNGTKTLILKTYDGQGHWSVTVAFKEDGNFDITSIVRYSDGVSTDNGEDIFKECFKDIDTELFNGVNTQIIDYEELKKIKQLKSIGNEFIKELSHIASDNEIIHQAFQKDYNTKMPKTEYTSVSFESSVDTYSNTITIYTKDYINIWVIPIELNEDNTIAEIKDITLIESETDYNTYIKDFVQNYFTTAINEMQTNQELIDTFDNVDIKYNNKSDTKKIFSMLNNTNEFEVSENINIHTLDEILLEYIYKPAEQGIETSQDDTHLYKIEFVVSLDESGKISLVEPSLYIFVD
jgi:hypothetical protein